eukprot:SAG11_NODE_7494_length_1137_cov_1.235067_1_plen_39_part_10
MLDDGSIVPDRAFTEEAEWQPDAIAISLPKRFENCSCA